jgi:4'-phosphopantetheinyl transferase
VLLKSRAFLQLNGPPFSSTRSDKTTLVQLPRTIHKKPYIPRQVENGNSDDGCLSVSHQFPYVGAARLWKGKGDQNLLVGCDIVVQEPLNTKLYFSWDDFLQVFRESFAVDEWDIIVAGKTPQARLHEFFLRWSVKEAYTKALGVGLGFDFASFAVSFQLPATCSSRLASFLSAEPKPRQNSVTETCLRGTVHGPNNVLETWEFSFVNLSQDPWSWLCIAVGPVHTETSIDLHARWTTFDALVSW